MTDDPDAIATADYQDIKAVHPGVSDLDLLIALQRARAEDHEWTPGPTEPRRVHDWRTHVGEAVARTWSTIPVPVRVTIALDAERATDGEEWE